MSIADKNNVTLRSDKSTPLTQQEVDNNFNEVKNVITDSKTNETNINGLRSDIDALGTDAGASLIGSTFGTVQYNIKQWQDYGYPEFVADDGTGSPLGYQPGRIVWHSGTFYQANTTTNTAPPSAQWDEVSLYGKTAVFDSVADMVASDALVIGMSARTLGYYAPGDGGGNDYEIVAAATGTDDGGSFIDLSGSGLQAKGLFLGGVSIRQFGADESNSNNSPNIQNAIDYVSPSIKSLIVPSGVYDIQTELVVDTSSLVISGVGSGGFAFQTQDIAPSVISATAAIDSIIRFAQPTTGSNAGNRVTGIKFLGNGNATRGMWHQSFNPQLSYSDVKVIGCGTCFQLDESCWSPHFERVMVNFSSIGFDLRDKNHNAVFIKCVTRSTGGTDGVRLGVDGSMSSVSFVGCDFEANFASSAQVAVLNARAVSFKGCYFEGRDSTPLASVIVLGSNDGSTSALGVTIDSCYMQGLNIGERAISFRSCDGVDVTGCYIYGFTVRAFTSSSTSNVKNIRISESNSIPDIQPESDSNTLTVISGRNIIAQSLSLAIDLRKGSNVFVDANTDFANPMVPSISVDSSKPGGMFYFHVRNTSGVSETIQFSNSTMIAQSDVVLASGERYVGTFIRDGVSNNYVEASRIVI